MGESSWSSGGGGGPLPGVTPGSNWQSHYGATNYVPAPSSSSGGSGGKPKKPTVYSQVGKYDISPMSLFGNEKRYQTEQDGNILNHLPDLIGNWLKERAPEPLKGVAELGGRAVGGVLGLTGNVLSDLPSPVAPIAVMMAKESQKSDPVLYAQWQTENPPMVGESEQDRNDAWLRYAMDKKDVGPKLLRDALTPQSSIGGSLMQVLNATSIPSRLLQRNIIGEDETFKRIMSATPGDGAAGELHKQAVAEGWSRDRVVDEAIISNLGFSNDMLISTALTIATDPALWATLGTGAIERVGTSAGMRLGESFLTEIGADAAGALAKDAAAAGVLRGLEQRAPAELFSFAEKSGQYSAAIEKAMTANPMAARIYSTPQIAKVSRVVSRVLDPFTLFGGEKKQRGVSAWLSSESTQGALDSLGYVPAFRVRQALARMGLKGEEFDNALGRAVSNTTVKVGDNGATTRMMRLTGVDAAANPTKQAQLAADAMSDAGLRKAVADEVDRVKQVATDDEAAAFFQRLGATPEQAAREVAKLGDKEKTLIHYANFGRSVDTFLQAQREASGRFGAITKAMKTAAEKAKKKYLDPSTVSFANKDTLTSAEATEVLKAARRGDAEAVRNAVQQYGALNRSVDILKSDAEVMQQVDDLISSMLEKGHLPVLVDESKVIIDDALQAFIRDNDPYRLIYRPSEDSLMHVSQGADGRINGVSTWIDWTDDVAAPSLAGKLGAYRRDYITRPVYFGTIQRNAANRFRANTMSKFKVTQAEADRMFAATMRQAETQGVAARGLSAGEMWDAAMKTKIPTARNMTQREYVNAFLNAWEGDLNTVGLSQKVTGRLKTFGHTVTGGNPVGLLAEKVYPLMRYKYNPYYILQEVFETPINMLSRGIMPGKWYDDELLDETRRLVRMMPDTEYGLDQIEQTTLVTLQKGAAEKVGRAIVDTPQRGIRFAWGMVRQEHKQVAELRQFINRVGDDFTKNMLANSPETYGRMMAEYGHLPGGQRGAVVRWLHDLAARGDPEGLYSHAMPHAVRPVTIGARARVSEKLVAHLVGADDFDALRRNVLNPGNADWTEQGVREQLLQAGADQDYIERAMAHVVGPTEDQWYEGFIEQGMKPAEVEALKDIVARVADLHELTPRELIGMTQAGKPISLNELGKYRGPTLYQSVLDANKARGFETLPIDHPIHVEMQDLANRELSAIPKSAGGRKKVKTYGNALEQQRVTKGGRPTGARVEFHGPKPTEGQAAGGPIHLGGELTADDHMRLLQRVMSDEDIRSMALWYDQMRSSILALAGNDPELGAKMLLRFAYTQMNTSPEQGMRMVLRITEDLHTGALKPEELLTHWDKATEDAARTAYGLNAERLLKSGADIWEEADAAGLGQKLMDFTDSMVGNRLRMADGYRTVEQGGSGLGPYAGDVHARRSEGFFDVKQTKYIQHMTGDETARLDPVLGYVSGDGKTVYVDRAAISDQSQPTAQEYAYILNHGNEMVDAFNREGFAGITDWTSEKVQAVLWSRVRQSSGDYAGSPLSALYSNIWNAGMEIRPGKGMPSRIYPFANLTLDQQRLVTERAGHVVADHAAEVSGTRVISRGRYNGGWLGQHSPGFGVELAGSPDGAQNFADAAALMGGQDEVWLSRTMRHINEASPTKPVLTKASGAGQQHFSVDVTLADGTTQAQLDDIAESIKDKADLWPGKGYTVGRTDDGRFMLRFIDADNRTWTRHTKATTDEKLDAFSDYLTTQGYTGHRTDRSIVHVVVGRNPQAKGAKPHQYGSSLLRTARRRNPAFADQLERSVERARTGVEQAYLDVDARVLAEHRAGLALDDPAYDFTRLPTVGATDGAAADIAYQRAPRGTRGATVTLDNARRLILISEQMKRGDTYLHEVWHSLEGLLQPSVKTRIVDAYNASRGLQRVAGQPLARAQREMSGPVSEWYVQQMVHYFRTGDAPDASLRSSFEFYREALKKIRAGKGEAKPSGHFKDVAESVFNTRVPAQRANYDIDQSALMAMAHERILESSRYAKRWTYFRPGRSVMERSLNHPYLGMYPLSYMYGQVLPHLVEFLAMRPFGLKAPFGGLIATNTVYQSMMLQQAYDPELRQFLTDNEPGLRAISTFTPGLPWEVPVNMSPPVRHFVAATLENLQRGAKGQKLQDVDWMKIGEDVASRAFNPVTQIQQATDAGAGILQLGAKVAGAAMPTPDYATAPESFLAGGNVPATGAPPPLPGPQLPGPLAPSTQSVMQSQGDIQSAADDLQNLFSEGVYPTP